MPWKIFKKDIEILEQTKKERGKITMNYKRVLSGVILFPIMAIIFIFGNTYFVDTLISIIAIMGLYEYYNAFNN